MLTDNQRQLVYWIKEREKIATNKWFGNDKPWTDNKVMQETYFCNVNREDDKVTMWIRSNFKYGFHTEYYDFSMIVARIFNLPSTLNPIGQPTSPIDNWLASTKGVLQDKKCREEKIWNGAYIISTNGKKIDKLTYCMDILKKAAKKNITIMCDTLAEAHKELITIEGLGSFLAAQVVADLKNTEGHPLNKAKDWKTFSAPGPGSLRGLSWFWGEKITNSNYGQKILDAYLLIENKIPMVTRQNICMQNFQNCLCEYDKFMRVTTGTGRSKRKYNGAT